MKQQIMEKILGADMILVGIGEEFEEERLLRQNQEYVKRKTAAEATGKEWLIPAINRFYSGENTPAVAALSKLAELIKDKNYFLITENTNDLEWSCGFRKERIVAPCGGSRKKQCANGMECQEAPQLLIMEEISDLKQCLVKGTEKELTLGVCPKCGAPMILNNIYTERYNEQGYLEQWKSYTKWLQGTLNKRLCILELGVGMKCPSVIRFPFEKIGYFNQKASFIRANEKLYQLTPQLKEKGVSISENAVDWIAASW